VPQRQTGVRAGRVKHSAPVWQLVSSNNAVGEQTIKGKVRGVKRVNVLFPVTKSVDRIVMVLCSIAYLLGSLVPLLISPESSGVVGLVLRSAAGLVGDVHSAVGLPRPCVLY
jgi:hypothetical protein